jgi:putative phage-type endonuclease
MTNLSTHWEIDMKATIHNIQQGSDLWLRLRSQYNTASEAPAALGFSKYQTRTSLIKQKSTGLADEIDGAKQALFDRGHAAEDAARAIAEEIIGEDLFPITATLTVDEVPLLASLDGATLDGKIIWEHKLFSSQLAADILVGILDPHYSTQIDQQLLVTGAEKCLFMTSDGTNEKMAHQWYYANQSKFDALIAGWHQFTADCMSYVPAQAVAEAVGRAPETLPALRIEVTGMVTASNLAEFKQTALAVFAGINRELTTDTEFANAEKTIKWCGDVEDRLAAAKQHALSQTESIDDLFRTIDDISAEARAVRLELDKLIKTRKEQVRGEIVAGGIAELQKHIAGLNIRLGNRPYMPIIAADFAGAIKGKRTVDSLRDAVSTTLANSKISASAIADKIQANLTTLRELAKDYAFLFADTANLVLKDTDTVENIIKIRIMDHKEAEAKKETEQRERIRAEEVARLAREAIAEAQATTVPAPVQAQPMVSTVTVRQVDRPLFQSTQPAPAVKVNTIREEINARLDNLSDADLPRILSFLKSRYPQGVTA